VSTGDTVPQPSKGTYHGPIWGALPPDYPTERAESIYRKLLDDMDAKSHARALMGLGFKGVAYRFRAAADYQGESETSYYAPGGAAPPLDEQYRQERALFGFFVSGLASLESFAFATHAAAAHYKSAQFLLSDDALRAVDPRSVADGLARLWPSASLTEVWQRLIADDAFRKWKEVRNILSHRLVPPRLIAISPGSQTQTAWSFTNARLADSDEAFDKITGPRRLWLGRYLCDLGCSRSQLPASGLMKRAA